MEHSEHVHLIQKAIPNSGGVWADFGSGEGAFTLALRDLAGPDVVIYSVDKDTERIKHQKEMFETRFPQSNIHYFEQDFTQILKLPLLDGVVMANSLHYVKDKSTFLKTLSNYLKPHGKLVLVEYSIDKGNQWVPYPLSYPTFEILATQTGFKRVELLEKIPSTYWDEMYCAHAMK